MLRRRGEQCRFQIELEQAEHLGVAVLLDHVNPVVLLHEVVHFAGKRIGPQAQIVGFDVVFLAQLIAALDQSPVRSAVADDPDFGFAGSKLRAAARTNAQSRTCG